MKKLKYVLPILLLVNILCMMDVSIMTIVLPEIQSAFNESLSNLSWAINIYTIIFASLIIPFGRLAERVGKNKFVFTGLIIFGIGSLLTGISSNLPFMLVARAIQSTGAAMIIPTSMVIGLELTNDNSRNKTVGALAGAQGLAVALGPAIGGVVSQYLGWRWVFFINIPLILIVLIIFPIVLPLRKEKTTNLVSLDWIGTILSIVLLFSFSLALVQGKDWGWTSISIIALLLTSTISFILFILVELKVTNPMINMKLFKNRNFTGSSLALILCNYFLGGFVILIPTFLTKVYGHSELSAALLITPYSISVMFSVIITSLIIKKVNNKAIIAIGFLFIGIAYYMLANLNLDNNSLPLIYAGIVLGIGYGIVASAANILAASDFHGTLLTDSQSVANVLRQVGLIISIAIFASLLTNNINNSKNHLINYSNAKVQKLDIQSAVKNKITKKIHHKLNPNNNNVSNANSNLTKNKFKVPNKKVKMIKSLAYNNALSQISLKTNIETNSLPPATKRSVEAKVNDTVNKKVKTQENHINSQIMPFFHNLKHEIKKQFKNSFLDVYKTMILLPFLSLLIVPIFKFKKRSNSKDDLNPLNWTNNLGGSFCIL